jgi:hypothetical protein
LLLAPASFLTSCGAEKAAQEDRLPALIGPSLQNQHSVLPADDPDGMDLCEFEESSDDEEFPTSHLAPSLTFAGRRPVKPSPTGLTHRIPASTIRSPLLRC